MSWYEFWKILHVVGAIIWAGSGIFFNVLMGRLGAAQEIPAIRAISKQTDFFGKFFGAVSGVTLLTGIMVVISQPIWGFAEPFVTVGFVGFVLSSYIGPRMISPAAIAVGEAIDAGEAARAQELGQKLGKISMVDSLIVMIVVVFMVWKP